MQLDDIKPITREEIQQALKNYLAEGGHIKILPPQQNLHHAVIGGSNWGVYEEIQNLLYSD